MTLGAEVRVMRPGAKERRWPPGAGKGTRTVPPAARRRHTALLAPELQPESPFRISTPRL